MANQRSRGEFRAYFCKTFKSAKWLIVKQLALAFCVTITSVVSNFLDFDSLTYFNAVMALANFSEVLGFSICNGIAVFVNQNTHKKSKVKKYITTGFLLCVKYAFAFVLILLLLKLPLLKGLFALENINYSFYYLMLGYMFFNVIFNYIIQCMQSLKIFFCQMVLAMSQLIILSAGFVLVWLGIGLNLTHLGLMYFLSTIILIIFALALLARNKKLKINLLKKDKQNLASGEYAVILEIILQSMVCQIGIVVLSFFMLKISEVYFNQYAFFENVLDLFNCFFYAYISVASLDVCQHLGRGEFDRAYKTAKYSICSSVLIWLGYFAMALLLSTLITSGMNVEIRSGALISLIMYGVLNLFRFLSVNLMQYILSLGGEIKALVWQELGVTIYYISVYFLSAFFAGASSVVVYLVLIIPVVFQTALGLYLFKSKKWMKTVKIQKLSKISNFN